MTTVDEQRVNSDKLQALVTTIFAHCAMEPADAAQLADSLVFADLSGVHSHGVLRVPEYVKKLTTGGVDPKGKPKVVRDSGACLVVDGGNSMGQIGTTFAMQQAIGRAYTFGIGVAAIRGSNHCGALAYFTRMALEADMIGIATTNALPTMAPWGGAQRILGINPLSFAIPASVEEAIVYDAAFSGASHGKLRVYQQKGLSLPEGWALDREGRPTIDPAQAIEGLLAPIGGFKGAGLAMIMGVLSSMLSGAAYGTELGSLETGPQPGQDGHFVMALRVGAFEEISRFKERVDQAIQQVHRSQLAPGFDRTYAPGEVEALNRANYRQQGIPLNRVTLADLQQTAQQVGLADIQLFA
ncbi:MAG: Ldh family oxidoreductase [Chloroflexi bacterium]|nr:Ldh family oxidoreductase [Chloroflexota bacterium]